MTDELDSMGCKALDFWKRKRTECKVKGGCKDFLK